MLARGVLICTRSLDLVAILWHDSGQPLTPISLVFRICKTIELESGHLLSKHPGNCHFPHGHTRSVELVFCAQETDANDMVLDFKAIKEMMSEFLSSFDHALCMNTHDANYETFSNIYGDRIIPFEGQDPTSERMAQRVYLYAKDALVRASAGELTYPVRSCVELDRVRVWETSSSWAEYSE